LAFDGASLKRP
jgi:hypothetical protein